MLAGAWLLYFCFGLVVSSTAPLDHADHAAVKVLATVLGGGMAGRLFAELRERQRIRRTTSQLRATVVSVIAAGIGPDSQSEDRTADGPSREHQSYEGPAGPSSWQGPSDCAPARVASSDTPDHANVIPCGSVRLERSSIICSACPEL